MCNHPIYEKDKLVPVDPACLPDIDYDALSKEPKGYKYLAYGMRHLGYAVRQDLPQLFGTERDELYQEMVEWLNGKDIDFYRDDL